VEDQIMRTFRDAKAMAKSLRQALAHRGVELSHSESLELVAHQFGLDNWNVLAARLNDSGVRFQPAVPILRIFSVDKAWEFYREFLGFTLDWEHRFAPELPLYAQVSRSGVTLHLSEHHGDASPGATVFVWLTGLDEFRQELLSASYPYARPGIEDAPWDARVMEVTDPFGNTLRFSERKPAA
jgi:uncharacterized glyoxalase superfamily protein PhnB